MVKFTQQQLDELRKKAIDFMQDERQLPLDALFIEMQGDVAVFGVWLNLRPYCKVGMPMYVSVSTNGDCHEIEDYNECVRLLKLLSRLRSDS